MQKTLFVNQGSDYNITIDVVNSQREAVDFTGKDLIGRVKKSVGSSNYVEFTITVNNAAAGNITLSLDAAITSALSSGSSKYLAQGIYIYDVYSRDTGTLDNETKVLYGSLNLKGSASDVYTPTTEETPAAYPPAEDILSVQDIVTDDQTDDDSRPVAASVIKSIRDIIDNLNLTGDPLEADDIINDLTTGGVNAPLSAEQGVALKTLIDSLQTSKQDIDQVLTDVINRISWNDNDKTFDIDSGIGTTIQIGQEIVTKVRNTTGSTILNGSVVRITGASGQRPTIALAQADSLSNINGLIGITTMDIDNNDIGFVTIHGLIRDLDTSEYSEGDQIYLSDITAGGITATIPDIAVGLGVVTYTHGVNGTIFVAIENHEMLIAFANDPSSIPGFDKNSWKSNLDLIDNALTDMVGATVSDYDSRFTTVINSDGIGVLTPIGALTGKIIIPWTPYPSEILTGFNNNGNVTGVHIPKSVVSIGANAFYNTTGITHELKLSNSIISIGASAFESGWISGDLILSDSLTTIGSRAFYICFNLTGDLIIPDSVTTIGSDAFNLCSGFESLTLSSSLTTIESHTFNGCFGFTGDLIIPDSVTTINTGAFYECSGFESLTLSSSLATISEAAFSGCTTIAGTLSIPDSITSIGPEAFFNCENITRVEIYATTAPTLDSTAFDSMSGVSPAEIHVPVGATGYAASYSGLTVVYDL